MVDSMNGTRIARRGLAPLELVLALPILLAVVALIVNYGIVATWKVRGLTAARQQLWSNRWPRTGNLQPTLAYWQTTGAAQSYGTGRLPELDDPRVKQPVVRGPRLLAAEVKEDLLDPARFIRIHRSYLLNIERLARLELYAKDSRWAILTDGVKLPVSRAGYTRLKPLL